MVCILHPPASAPAAPAHPSPAWTEQRRGIAGREWVYHYAGRRICGVIDWGCSDDLTLWAAGVHDDDVIDQNVPFATQTLPYAKRRALAMAAMQILEERDRIAEMAGDLVWAISELAGEPAARSAA